MLQLFVADTTNMQSFSSLAAAAAVFCKCPKPKHALSQSVTRDIACYYTHLSKYEY